MYYPLTQVRKPRPQVITRPRSRGQKRQSWEPMPRLHAKAWSLMPFHLAQPVPGTGPRDKANNPPALGSQGPTCGIWPGRGKEPREVPVDSPLPGPPAPQEGELPRMGLVASFLDPQITQGWDPKGCRVQQKRLPASPPVLHSHPITTLGQRHYLLEGVPQGQATANGQPHAQDRTWHKAPG